MTNPGTGIETPCVSVCVVHPQLSLCVGCGRSLDEIAHWIGLGIAERRRIMSELPARLAAVGHVAAVAATA
jgi:hypothetical protein